MFPAVVSQVWSWCRNLSREQPVGFVNSLARSDFTDLQRDRINEPYGLDAKVEKVRDGGRVVRKALVLAYAVHESGYREVIVWGTKISVWGKESRFGRRRVY